MHSTESIAVFLLCACLLFTQAGADTTFATGGAGGGYLTGTLWDPPRAADGRLYIEDINALPPNTFVRLSGSQLKANIDSAYQAAGRPSIAGVQGAFDYSGMAWDPANLRGWACGGGHATTGGNGVHRLEVAKGRWEPEAYETAPGYNGFTQNDADFWIQSTNESYSKGLFRFTGDLSGLHDTGAVTVYSFSRQSPQLYVRPFARSSTGFAVKSQGNPWSTAYVEAPGPEGFVTTQAAYDAIFPDTTDARPQIKNVPGGLWDGTPFSWHTYYFQNYVPSLNMLIISAYGRPNWWVRLDGTGWAPVGDAEYPPFNSYLSINSWGGLSASRVMVDTARSKLWFGSHVGNNANYWYTDPARLTELGFSGQYWFWSNHLLSYDLVTKQWGSKTLKANANHTYFNAGRRFGDMGYNGNPGHIFDMATESDTLADFGDSASGPFAHHVTAEGFGAAYLSDLGKLWCFAGGKQLRITEYDIDSPQPGAGRNGSLLIPARNIIGSLSNYSEVAEHSTVGVYNRVQYFPGARLLVLCASTQWEVYYCRVNTLTSTVSRPAGPVRAAMARLSCSPNPFGRSAAARITLPSHEVVSYSVYDLGGKLVRTFSPGPDNAPVIVWNGCDGQGRPLASGVYMGRVVMEKGRALEHRLVILR